MGTTARRFGLGIAATGAFAALLATPAAAATSGPATASTSGATATATSPAREAAVNGRGTPVDGGEVAVNGREVAVDGREVAADGREVAADGREVAAERPARVVSTTEDGDGRPVIEVLDTPAEVRAARRTADTVEADVPVSVAGVTDSWDPLRSLQWDLGRIDMAGAWARSTGAGITVAVVDSGVDATHPDLAGQVLPGINIVTGVEGAATDDHGHGTHVAGTIAATAGNGAGVTGMAPDVRILPVRILGADGGGYMSDAANGVVWAADHGADVINLSISADTSVQAMVDAIAYARSRNIVVVAAAGNDRRAGSPVSYPAADPGVIAVSATDSTDAMAEFSNRGSYVDLAAPGHSIVSTYPVATGHPYVRMNGTSMAAPHVAAVAALLKAADRALTPDQVEQALTASAIDLGEPGRDDDFGAGLLNAGAALATGVRN